MYVVLFGLALAVMIGVWFGLTTGERACRAWLEGGEPRLESITLEIDTFWRDAKVTCDDEEALRYLEHCFAEGCSYRGRAALLSPNSGDDLCEVRMRFENGVEYRFGGEAYIRSDGLFLHLPGQNRLDSVSFDEPMPAEWKSVLNRLLGAGMVK